MAFIVLMIGLLAFAVSLTFFAGATASNAGWWVAWPLIVLAVLVLGLCFGVALRRVTP